MFQLYTGHVAPISDRDLGNVGNVQTIYFLNLGAKAAANCDGLDIKNTCKNMILAKCDNQNFQMHFKNKVYHPNCKRLKVCIMEKAKTETWRIQIGFILTFICI